VSKPKSASWTSHLFGAFMYSPARLLRSCALHWTELKSRVLNRVLHTMQSRDQIRKDWVSFLGSGGDSCLISKRSFARKSSFFLCCKSICWPVKLDCRLWKTRPWSLMESWHDRRKTEQAKCSVQNMFPLFLDSYSSCPLIRSFGRIKCFLLFPFWRDTEPKRAIRILNCAYTVYCSVSSRFLDFYHHSENHRKKITTEKATVSPSIGGYSTVSTS
jgi:hypothetical protein